MTQDFPRDQVLEYFVNVVFEEPEEECAIVIEEFYPNEFDNGSHGNAAKTGTKPGLADKLNKKASQLNGNEA